jgi:hypothetical protein
MFPSSERLNLAQKDTEPNSAIIKKDAGSSKTSEDTFTRQCENSKRS